MIKKKTSEDKELKFISNMKGPFKILAYAMKFKRMKELLLGLLCLAIIIIVLQNLKCHVKTDKVEFEYNKAADIKINREL